MYKDSTVQLEMSTVDVDVIEAVDYDYDNANIVDWVLQVLAFVLYISSIGTTRKAKC